VVVLAKDVGVSQLQETCNQPVNLTVQAINPNPSANCRKRKTADTTMFISTHLFNGVPLCCHQPYKVHGVGACEAICAQTSPKSGLYGLMDKVERKKSQFH
jgi:hypothetical protein